MDTTATQDTGQTKGALPNLPALRSLGSLADRLPCVVIDSREQTPLPIARLPTKRDGLQSGDYSVVGLTELFTVERKSIADLVSCCMKENRERFERELHRLRGFRFKRLLIVGSREDIEAGVYRSQINPAAVMGSLYAWEVRFDIPVVFADTPETAARQVERWAWYFAREQTERINDLLRGTAAPAKD